jgi:alginate O-acetyltransferase complex protein AlgI
MTPTSVAFAVLVLAALLLHWLGPRRSGWQNSVLLGASAIFYWTWSPAWLPVLALSTLVDFWASQKIGDASADPRLRRAALWVALGGNLGVLLWFKYAGFLLDSGSLLLPIGLSYYTLIRVGYLLDLRYGRVAVERSLLNFAAFVWFFPQMVAGPITRARAMLPQFASARSWRDVNLGAAAGALLLGWTLKAYVADWIGPAIVDPVFAASRAFGAAAHWLALVGYALQVFGDFAGYSLLAIGVAALFGMSLPVNFDRPFLSRSMPEFWRRWHISLNTWLFDYVFGPLTTGGGALHGRIAVNLVLIFVISGLWHGAQSTFVLWGLLHGLALAAHHGWDLWYRAQCRRDRRFVTARKSTAYAVAAWVLTQGWFLGSLLLFRSNDLASAGQYLGALFVAEGNASLPLDSMALASLLAVVAIVGWHHAEGLNLGAKLRARIDALPAPVIGALLGLGLAWLLIFAPLARTSFIYAQF